MIIAVMSSKNKRDDFILYEDLIDSDSSQEPTIIDGTFYFFLVLINGILTRTGVRKIALVKESDRDNYELLVKCPYCQSVYYQKKVTRKFKCPHCQRKSPIITTKGELANLFFKRVNNSAEDNERYSFKSE